MPNEQNSAIYVMVALNPASRKPVAIVDDEGNIATYPSYNAAQDAADNTTICRAWPYKIIELNF